MNSKNEVFEYLVAAMGLMLDERKAHKQQCEDLAHEVLSLKNQLRDASALVAELQKELEHTGNEYRRAIDYALSDAPEQSGCRKEDTQECEHVWYFYGDGGSCMCYKCGVNKPEECEHEWRTETFYGEIVAPTYCRKCGLKK